MTKSIRTKERLSPKRRIWHRFKSNRRGYFSLLIFVCLFGLSLVAELICNDKPLMVVYEGRYYFPIIKTYPETVFGGIFETETDYRDPYFLEQMENDNRAYFPFIPNSYDTINYTIDGPVPSPPTSENILGTDDRGRDVFARLLYGFRLSVLFGLALTAVGTLLGILIGAIQGFMGGRTDLFMQRFIEIWNSMPELLGIRGK